MATVSSSAEKRSGKRLDVSIPSRLRHGGFDQADVRICNLSFRGFRAECEKPLTRGDFVSIDLPQIGLVRARIRSAEHPSELQSLLRISYAVFRLKQKKNKN